MANDRAKQLFNDGVTASLNASEQFSAGDVDGASQQSQLAIDRFREAITLDPLSALFKGALGHELYVHASMFGGEGYAEAAECLVEALRAEPDNVAFLSDLGMCLANQGDLAEARNNFARVFELDATPETAEHVAYGLADIGRRAFEYGTSLQESGEHQQGLSYKKFAIGASMLGYQSLDGSRDLARQVSDFAADIGDAETAKRYAALSAG